MLPPERLSALNAEHRSAERRAIVRAVAARMGGEGGRAAIVRTVIDVESVGWLASVAASVAASREDGEVVPVTPPPLSVNAFPPFVPFVRVVAQTTSRLMFDRILPIVRDQATTLNGGAQATCTGVGADAEREEGGEQGGEHRVKVV